MRVIESRQVSITETLAVHEDNGPGKRFLFRRGSPFLSEVEGYESAPGFVLEAGPLAGKSVAWIGGGFCVGPRVFAIADCKQTVYEIEPALAEFCPEGVEFVPGDYRDTMRGTYDVIVYDLGGDVPREFLSKHLNDGGVILPKED